MSQNSHFTNLSLIIRLFINKNDKFPDQIRQSRPTKSMFWTEYNSKVENLFLLSVLYAFLSVICYCVSVAGCSSPPAHYPLILHSLLSDILSPTSLLNLLNIILLPYLYRLLTYYPLLVAYPAPCTLTHYPTFAPYLHTIPYLLVTQSPAHYPPFTPTFAA